MAQVCQAINGAKWMVQLSAGLEARGYEVVAIIGGSQGDTAARLRTAGVRFAVHRHAPFSLGPFLARITTFPLLCRLRYPLSLISFVREAVGVARLLRRLDVDVVHTHTFTSIMVGRIAAFLARVPVRVAMIPGPYHLEAEAPRRMDLATAWMDHRLLCGCRHSEYLYRRSGVSPRRLTTVPYGVDPGEFDPESNDGSRFREELGISRETPLIGQVAYFYPVLSGRFVPPLTDGRGPKGHDDFVAAARLVVDVRPDARFVLVGAGFGPAGEDHRRTIQQMVEQLGLADVVTFTGHRDDVVDVLAALDVSVQCSLSENYGGTLESLLMKAPTIATAVGGMPEVILHEITGLLVPPRDPDALARAMLRLVDDRDLAHGLAARGRRHVLGNFTVQHMIDRVIANYEDLARIRGPAAAISSSL